jgi:fumarylacetoacetate (FAA) hydrolase
LGLLHGDRVIDVAAAIRDLIQRDRWAARDLPEPTPPTSLQSALAHWDEWSPLLRRLQREYPHDHTSLSPPLAWSRESVRYHAPLSRAPSFRDFYAFEAHVRAARRLRGLEMVPQWYEIPSFYFSNPTVFCGPDAVIAPPPGCGALDYELEVGAIIGRGGRDIDATDAEAHIAGYCILNDWSARDLQRQEMLIGLGPAKGKDFATGLGPWLVTPDELAPHRDGSGYDLRMLARRDGMLLSSGNWRSIHWSFGEMVAHASRGVTLFPGDVLGSGTVGSGCILELTPEAAGGWLRPGDTVEMEIEELGLLRQRVGPSRANQED